METKLEYKLVKDIKDTSTGLYEDGMNISTLGINRLSLIIDKLG